MTLFPQQAHPSTARTGGCGPGSRIPPFQSESNMTQSTRHFDHAEWVDFVRDQSPSDQRREMLAHLQSGCSKCNKIKDLLDKFAAVCRSEEAYIVPEAAERSVKAIIFSLNRPPAVSIFQRMFGDCLFDSCNDPLPVGIRTGHQISRHVLFQAGDYSVDLRFEHERGAASMVMVGQIANRRLPEELMAHVPVILCSGGRELTRSLSNSFGEFQLEYVPQANLNLRVPLEARGQELEVVLNEQGAG